MKKITSKTIGMAVLVLAVLMAVVMIKTRPKAQRKKMVSMVPMVTVSNIARVTVPVKVQCLGKVAADVSVALRAEVSGRVVAEYPDLVEGSFIEEGDLLYEIDSRDYELAVRSAEADLRSAGSDLRIEEGRQAVAVREMELLGSGTTIDDTYRDLMLREPQREAALAAVDAAEVTLAAARLDLERTVIRAPFDAVIAAVSKRRGDYAQSGEALVELIATERLFVRASMPIGNLKNFPDLEDSEYAAHLILSDGTERRGILHRLRPELTSQGGMAGVLIAVQDPFVARMLLIDEVARVDLSGREVADVCLIQRKHLRDGPAVWMVDADNILHVCPAQVVQGYADQVLVRFEFADNWKMITSNIAAPIDGMKLRVMDIPGGAE